VGKYRNLVTAEAQAFAVFPGYVVITDNNRSLIKRREVF
jgi:hypothetical protein